MPTSLPETQNCEWGFFSTISHLAAPEPAWDIALAFTAGITGCSLDATCAFLDSRHFVGEVSNRLVAGQGLASAINAPATTWMGWRIGPRAAHESGIPRGLSSLTGYVLGAEIEADTTERRASLRHRPDRVHPHSPSGSVVRPEPRDGH